jgi:hypothetical protein
MNGFSRRLAGSPWLACTVILFLLWNCSSRAEKIGSITFILGAPGDIERKAAGSAEWAPARLKAEVNDGDAIRTRVESRCEITLLDGAIIRIGENSSFEFIDVNLKSAIHKLKAELPQGNVWINAATAKAGKKEFQLKAPTAVCAIRGTIYRVEADSVTTCKVYDGKVDVGPVTAWGQRLPKSKLNGPPQQVPGPSQLPGPYQVTLEQWQQIVRGFQIVVRKDGKFDKSAFDQEADAANDWVKWNKELDAKAAQ